MDHKDFERFGEEVSQMVQNAVESKNFEMLSKTISKTINQVVLEKGMKYHRASERVASETKPQRPPINTLVRVPSKFLTVLAASAHIILGSYLAMVSLFAFSGIFTSANPSGIAEAIIGGLAVGAMAAGALAMAAASVKKVMRLGRFRNYIARIGEREYCDIKYLTESVGKTKKVVVKDLQYMIKNCWFIQGHLDKKKTCLMITDQIYEQYLALEKQKALEDKEAKEKMEKNSTGKKKSGSKLSPEVQKVIDQGEDYLKKLRACNDAIPGEEISEKIHRIELVTEKIFDRVEQEQKCVSDIGKLMDYYLPTTVKLLEAYAEMDAQPVGGENINAAKKEIEATLDTLNVAFEKLLDSLFQEKAWDVSSDISVLNTILAQEGLKEDGLKKN